MICYKILVQKWIIFHIQLKYSQNETKRDLFSLPKYGRRHDLNVRPQGYEPCELPDCSTPPQIHNSI